MGLIGSSLLQVPALIAMAVVAGRAAAIGRRPWLPLAGVWIAVALGLYLAASTPPAHPVTDPLVLLAPLGVTALSVDMEVRRGCSLRHAGGIGVLLGTAVSAGIPWLFVGLSMLLTSLSGGSH